MLRTTQQRNVVDMLRSKGHRKRKPRKTPSLMTVVKQFVSLVLETSSVHGFNHVAARDRHPAENFMWVFIIILGSYGAYYFGMSTLRKYENSPTAISLERNHLEWSTVFPAITICPSTKVDKETSEDVIRKWFGETVNTTEALEWLSALFSANYENFDQLEIEDRLPPTQYIQVLMETAFKLSATVGTSSGDGSLERVFTEAGLCYTFNSPIADLSRPELWVNNTKFTADQLLKNEVFKGYPNEGAMEATILDINSDHTLYLHSPFEVPDISKPPMVGELQHFLNLGVTIARIVASEDIREIAVSRRKCRFADESNLEFSPIYSYAHCKMDCRIRLAYRLCHCTPYFYRQAKGYPTCNVQGMKCLGRHKEKLISLKGETCNCLQSCEENIYQVVHVTVGPWVSNNVKCSLLKYPRTQLKRDLFFTQSDLLVQLGGSASLCLGCSVLSFCEFLYLFTLRLILFIINKIRSH